MCATRSLRRAPRDERQKSCRHAPIPALATGRSERVARGLRMRSASASPAPLDRARDRREHGHVVLAARRTAVTAERRHRRTNPRLRFGPRALVEQRRVERSDLGQRVSSSSSASVSSLPRKNTLPALGTSSPPRIFSSVDFPLPEAPRRTKSSPSRSDRSTPASAVTWTSPMRYSLRSPRHSRTHVVAGRALDAVGSASGITAAPGSRTRAGTSW
jgi:hypothetical protein